MSISRAAARMCNWAKAAPGNQKQPRGFGATSGDLLPRLLFGKTFGDVFLVPPRTTPPNRAVYEGGVLEGPSTSLCVAPGEEGLSR